MNLLETLTCTTNEEQLCLYKLPTHAAASQTEHLRRHYALLLAAVLTTQPIVSEPQTRLLQLLLESLELEDIRGFLFDEARKLTPKLLLEATCLIRSAGFSQHLVLDAIVLLRIYAPLEHDTVRLVSELACFLDLGERELTLRADDAAEILGLHAEEESDRPEVELAIERSRLLTKFWPSHLTQPLTAEALQKGLRGMFYTLDADLEVDFPWKAENSIFLFRNGATLRTLVSKTTTPLSPGLSPWGALDYHHTLKHISPFFTDSISNTAIKLTHCHLFNTALEFDGRQTTYSVTLQNCNWRGNYDPTAQRTTLKCRGATLTVNDCDFSTINARAIRVQFNTLTVKNSSFTHCGHTDLYGGAIWHSDEGRTIENSTFDRCVAALGGALRFNKIYGINDCIFLDCKSKERIQAFKAGEDTIAIFANIAEDSGSTITRCKFYSSSSLIVKAKGFLKDSRFYESTFYYKYKNKDHPTKTINCAFTDSNEIWFHDNDRFLEPKSTSTTEFNEK